MAGGFPADRSMVGYGRVMTARDADAEPAGRTDGSRSLAAGVVRGEHVDAAGPAGPTEPLTAGAAGPTESLAVGVVRGGHLQAAGPAGRTDDSPEPGTGPDEPRRRPIGLWLVAAALGPWLGAMLFLVGPENPADEGGARPEPPPAGAAPGAAVASADAGGAGGSGRRAAQPRLVPVSRREPAPGFALPDLDGGAATLADYTGRVLLLNFWATWCLPCRAEMPWFADFETAFGGAGFAVLGVSLDEPGRDAVEPFLERSPVNYRIALADTAPRLAPFGPLNTLPTTWLIDRQGRIAAEHVGLVSRAAIEAEIRLLLDE